MEGEGPKLFYPRALGPDLALTVPALDLALKLS